MVEQPCPACGGRRLRPESLAVLVAGRNIGEVTEMSVDQALAWVEGLPLGGRARHALDPAIAAKLKRTAEGLVPAVVQQHDTGEVLMLGWMDDEALARTLSTGRATYWSRSRGEYWVKGETSGHHQHVKEVRLDCDGDTLLVKVDQVGVACHTGDRTCFDAALLSTSDG